MAGVQRAIVGRAEQESARDHPRPQEPAAPAVPEALLALQRGAGNQAVTRMLSRMQLVATDPDKVESDHVVLMNMRHARDINARKGVDTSKEKIASLGGDYSGDDIDFAHKEVVFLHGHGNIGMYQGLFVLKPGDKQDMVTYEEAAEVIAAKLKTVTREDKKGQPFEIRILTCKAGNPNAPGNAPSLVKALQTELATAPSVIKIKGFVNSAFSYPGWKSHQEPDVFTDPYEKTLKPQFELFKEWLKTDEGKAAGYPERLRKIEELIPQDLVDRFMADLRQAGAYAKQARRGEPPDPLSQTQTDTILKVFNKTT